MADPAIQKSLLKAVLSLPPPVLRAAAGGRAVYLGGRTLEPRFQFLIHAARHFVSQEGQSDDKSRTYSVQQLALACGRCEPGVRREDMLVDSREGAVPARLYRHDNQDSAMPLLVYANDGESGFEICDAFCSILARCGQAPVLAISCQPGAEHRFTTCLDDLMTAYRWGRDNAARFGAPAGVAAIGGESIGGALAAIICQDLKRLEEPQPSLQLLLYPWVDLSGQMLSMGDYADSTLPEQDLEPWSAKRYLGPDDDPSDPRVSPLKAADLSGLAPAVVVTAGFDPLVDQGGDYAHRLAAAGTPTLYRCYDHLVHGFAGFTGVVPAADVACREIAGLMREGLQGRIPGAQPGNPPPEG